VHGLLPTGGHLPDFWHLLGHDRCLGWVVAAASCRQEMAGQTRRYIEVIHERFGHAIDHVTSAGVDLGSPASKLETSSSEVIVGRPDAVEAVQSLSTIEDRLRLTMTQNGSSRTKRGSVLRTQPASPQAVATL